MKKAFQIIFNQTSAAELAALPTLLQLEIVSQLETVPEKVSEQAGQGNTESADLPRSDQFGRMEREGRSLYRFRAGDYRLYFERAEQGIVVHRVLHKNTLKDFFFRSSLPGSEDEALQKNPDFWKMIDDRK